MRYVHRGTFGEIWIGRHELIDGYCAVKLVPNDGLGEVELSGIRQYRTLAESNPGLIPIHEFGETLQKQYYFYTMPLADDVKGRAILRAIDDYEPMTLRRFGDLHRPVVIDHILPVATNLLPSLQAIHKAGFVHRDVKPSNVVMVGGTWKLCDMGLLARRDKIAADSGTPGFIPPEGVRDRRADIYAFGKTVFWLATDCDVDDFDTFLANDRSLPGNDGRRHELFDIIKKCCDEDPEQRFLSAEEIKICFDRLMKSISFTLVLVGNLDAFTPADMNALLDAIRERGYHPLGLPILSRGSIRFTIELMPDEAQRLAAAVRAGEFAQFGVTDVDWPARIVPDPLEITPISSGGHTIDRDVSITQADKVESYEGTSIALLERLKSPTDSEAWNQFVHLYTPLLIYWARKSGIAEPDSFDVVQDVFVRLVRALPNYKYDPSKNFRAWLRVVVRHSMYERAQRDRLIESRDYNDQLLLQSPAPDEAAELEEAEYRQHLLARAMELIRVDVEGKTWQACWQSLVVGRSAAEVAQELGITVNSVYLARARVLKRLRHELSGLLDIDDNK